MLPLFKNEGIRMKALIAYGTRYGSTTDIANKMGEILTEEGIDVKIVNLAEEKIDDVSNYDLIIIGSSIKIGSWTKKSLEFLERFESDLSKKKTAFFVSCLDANDPKKCKEARENYLEKVAKKYPSIRPYKLGLFGGVIDMKKYGFGTKLMVKALSKNLEKQGIDINKSNDFRNWEEIQNWTRELLI
ncbi:nitric oxide synthase [Thermococci archaeon]|nr:MAG: nitric oxide synthase [Thermococci archaeon]